MLFSSPTFIFFFAGYLTLHLLLPLRFRLPLIILGSAIFYGYWNPYYLWMPFALTFLAYFGALWVAATVEPKARKSRLAVVAAMLLLPLLIVKYTNFVYADVIGPFAGFSGSLVNWALPLGISFITFTLIAYVVDVHARRFPVERNPTMLAGLVLFFPHLIAGPILRPAELLPQLHQQRTLRRLRPFAVFGITLFSIGLLKKLVFADTVGEVVERVYATTASGLTGLEYLIAIYGFALQIYCDFSGYTDMALGAALLLGVKLPHNFSRPYTATSVVDFWTRWHVTLSKWLRDYVYIPLGGNRSGYGRQSMNLFLTMALGGLWHGANWTFVLWGVAHGLGISFVHAVRRFKMFHWLGRAPRFIRLVVTFHFVAACWILFRAPDIVTAWRVASGPFVASWSATGTVFSANVWPLFLLVVFFLLHRLDDHRKLRILARVLPGSVLWPLLIVIWLLAMTVSEGNSAKFIYFDF